MEVVGGDCRQQLSYWPVISLSPAYDVSTAFKKGLVPIKLILAKTLAGIVVLFIVTIMGSTPLSGQTLQGHERSSNTDNLLTNPTWEGAPNLPSGWTLGNSATVLGDTVLLEPDPDLVGGWVNKIDDRDDKTAYKFSSEPMATQEGMEYEASVMARAGNPDDPHSKAGRATLYLEFFDEQGKQLRNPGTVNKHYTGTDWSLISVVGTAPENAVSVGVLLYSGSGIVGEAYFKSPKLKRIDTKDEPVLEMNTSREAGTFYVSPEGKDSYPGTKDLPWKSLDHVNVTVKTGDTVVFYPGSYDGILRPVRGGTRDNPITFKALERRTVHLGGRSGGAFAIQLVDVEHVHVEGFHLKPAWDDGRWLLIENSRYIYVDDVLMEDAGGSLAFRVISSEQVQVRDSVIRRYVGGNMSRISDSKYILLEGNAISRAGHNPFQFYPSGSDQYIVVRGNVFHPGWGRAFSFHAERDVLFEGNIITNAYDGGRSASTASKIMTGDSIFRFNRVFHNHAHPLSAGTQQDWIFEGVRMYNNVFDNNLGHTLATNIDSPTVQNVTFVNNIFYRNDPHGIDRQISFSGTDRLQLDSDGQPIPKIKFLSNVVAAADPNAKDTIGLSRQSLSIETLESAIWQEQSPVAKAIHFEGNVVDAPRFVDEIYYNHGLTPGSPLLNRGTFLTHAVSSGKGRVVSVSDAFFFYDGFGIEGEVGDTIAIGSPDQIARVVKVDRNNNELTLDRDVHWDEGDPVSLPWGGDAPDIGAFEYGTPWRPSVQVVTTPYMARPDEEIKLSVALHGIDDAKEIRWQLGDGTLAYGTELIHRYNEPYDYPIRVRVTTTSGDVYRGTGHVVVERPLAADEPFFHSTFNEDDEEWWWRWKAYRPMPAEYAQELDSTGKGMLRMTNPGGGTLPLKLAPVGWDVDRYPWIYMRYRVSPGTPVGFYLDGFTGDDGGERRTWIAAVPDERRLRSRRTVYELNDDGEWHSLLMDARLIRAHYPEVQVLRRLGAETLSNSKTGDTYWLDEVAILPLEALDHPDWQHKIQSLQTGHIEFISPTKGKKVYGEVDVSFELTPYAIPGKLEHVRVSHVDLAIDGALIASVDNNEAIGTDRLAFDSTEYEDGTYTLNVRAHLKDGTVIEKSTRMEIENVWNVTDYMLPPQSFFGATVDRSETVASSPGWRHATDSPSLYFDDVSRLVRMNTSEQYLLWETPNLTEAEVTVYSQSNTVVPDDLELSFSADQDQYERVDYDVVVVDRNEQGTYHIQLVARVPGYSDISYFRLLLGETDGAEAPIQIGTVRLSGRK